MSRNPKARSPSPPVKKLTTSVFVINCNLQRLDGPVGNGKIVNELKASLQVLAGTLSKSCGRSRWDELPRVITSGKLIQLMERNR